MVGDDDEVFSIKASGGVTRVSVGEVNPTGRVTMGVRFISLADDDTVVAIARNAERAAVEEELDEAPVEQSDGSPAGEIEIEAGNPAEPADDPGVRAEARAAAGARARVAVTTDARTTPRLTGTRRRWIRQSSLKIE